MWEIIEPKYGRRVHERTVDTLRMLHQEGKTLEQLGYFLGVSRERVRQLFEREGFFPREGGSRIRRLNKMEALKAKQLASRKKTETKMEALFKCPYDELVSICGMPINYGNIQTSGSPQNGYHAQMRNSLARGISWEITLPEWWKIWQDSGHWEYRGRHKAQYCMSRKNDQGSYRAGNVEIVTNYQNTHSGQTKFRQKERQRDELGLTKLERCVYDLMQAGFSSPSVMADKIGLKASTISQIKQNLKKRTGVFNGIQLRLR